MKKKEWMGLIAVAIVLVGSMSPAVRALENSESAVSTSQESSLPATAEMEMPEIAQEQANAEIDGDETEEAIIGIDDQLRITDTQSDPYRAVVHLELQFSDGKGFGTGVLIAPDLVLTVAHNVFTRSTQEWASQVMVTPGKNGDLAPYGSYRSTTFYIHSQYPQSSGSLRRQTDVAVLKLETPVPDAVGYLPVSTELMDGDRIQVAGYPADSDEKFGYMYTAFGTTYEVTEKTFTHQADTERGNSGSPILNSANQVVGVQSSSKYDKVTPISGTENYSRRVTADVLDMIDIARTNGALTEGVTRNPILPSSVTVTPATSTLRIGETVSLVATVTPVDAADTSVTWTTSDSGVAQVADGVVTAVAPGTATITATTVSGHQTATAQITVQAPTPTLQTLPVYRMYHAGLMRYFYTQNTSEYQKVAARGWKQEGVAWTTAKDQGEAVYRLYNPQLNAYVYTKHQTEYQTLSTRGWKPEGQAFRSYGEVPVYRLYHAATKTYFFTKQAAEYQLMATRGWKPEGIAFYAVK